MSAQVEENQWKYDLLFTSDLPHYMTLDEMHEKLTANIRKAFAQ